MLTPSNYEQIVKLIKQEAEYKQQIENAKSLNNRKAAQYWQNLLNGILIQKNSILAQSDRQVA